MGNRSSISQPLRTARATAKFSHDFALRERVEDGTAATEEAETIGDRSSQQDAMFVGAVGNHEAKTNPEDFLRTTIAGIVDHHKTRQQGTTICTTIARKVGNDVELTIGNLGDSRAALVIRHKDGTYESIILTEDHDLDVKRVADHIKTGGGSITNLPGEGLRVNGLLNMGAAIGDKEVGTCLLTTPDIWTYRLSQFLRPGETIADISASLVSSCDGLWDVSGGLSSDGKAILREGQTHPEIIPSGKKENILGDGEDRYNFDLAELKKRFDSPEGLVQAGTKFDNFADALVCLAAFPGGSTDNISVAHVPLITSGAIEIEDDEPIMATICDGHGTTLLHPGTRDKTPHPDSLDLSKDPDQWDGGLVASSVACELFRAADIQEIGGLEIQENQEFLYKMLGKTPAPKKAATAGHSASATASDTLDFEAFAAAADSASAATQPLPSAASPTPLAAAIGSAPAASRRSSLPSLSAAPSVQPSATAAATTSSAVRPSAPAKPTAAPTSIDEFRRKKAKTASRSITVAATDVTTEQDSLRGKIAKDGLSVRRDNAKFKKARSEESSKERFWLQKDVTVESKFGTDIFRLLARGRYASKQERLVEGDDGTSGLTKFDENLQGTFLNTSRRTLPAFNTSDPANQNLLKRYARMCGVLHVLGEHDDNPFNFFIGKDGKPVKIDNGFLVNSSMTFSAAYSIAAGHGIPESHFFSSLINTRSAEIEDFSYGLDRLQRFGVYGSGQSRDFLRNILGDEEYKKAMDQIAEHSKLLSTKTPEGLRRFSEEMSKIYNDGIDDALFGKIKAKISRPENKHLLNAFMEFMSGVNDAIALSNDDEFLEGEIAKYGTEVGSDAQALIRQCRDFYKANAERAKEQFKRYLEFFREMREKHSEYASEYCDLPTADAASIGDTAADDITPAATSSAAARLPSAAAPSPSSAATAATQPLPSAASPTPLAEEIEALRQLLIALDKQPLPTFAPFFSRYIVNFFATNSRAFVEALKADPINREAVDSFIASNPENIAALQSYLPAMKQDIAVWEKFPLERYSHDIDAKATDTSGIAMAETIGITRPTQQDAMFVGVVRNAAAIANPAEFLASEVGKAAERHAKCGNGTTFCSSIITAGADGKPVITVASLGDSRASLIIKRRDGSYRSIVLTQDHDLTLPRVRDAVIAKGGKIILTGAAPILNEDGIQINDDAGNPLSTNLEYITDADGNHITEITNPDDTIIVLEWHNKDGRVDNFSEGDDVFVVGKCYPKIELARLKAEAATAGANRQLITAPAKIPTALRLNYDLNMGASIGDHYAGEGKGIITTPDIFTYRLEDILEEGESVEDVSLIVSCDGLYDLRGKKSMGTDLEITSEDGKTHTKQAGTTGFTVGSGDSAITFSLSELKKLFDEKKSGEEIIVNGRKFSSFAAMLTGLAVHPGQSTDNVSVIHIPLIAGGVSKVSAANPIIATVCDGHGEGSLAAEDEKIAGRADDGGRVAASVACDIFTAADVKEITGLEIARDGFMSQILAARKREAEAAAASSTSAPSAQASAAAASAGLDKTPSQLSQVFAWRSNYELSDSGIHVHITFDRNTRTISVDDYSETPEEATRNSNLLKDQLESLLISGKKVIQVTYSDNGKQYCRKIKFNIDDLDPDRLDEIPLLQYYQAIENLDDKITDQIVDNLIDVIIKLGDDDYDYNKQSATIIGHYGNYVKIPILDVKGYPPLAMFLDPSDGEISMGAGCNSGMGPFIEQIVGNIEDRVKKHPKLRGFFYKNPLEEDDRLLQEYKHHPDGHFPNLYLTKNLLKRIREAYQDHALPSGSPSAAASKTPTASSASTPAKSSVAAPTAAASHSASAVAPLKASAPAATPSATAIPSTKPASAPASRKAPKKTPSTPTAAKTRSKASAITVVAVEKIDEADLTPRAKELAKENPDLTFLHPKIEVTRESAEPTLANSGNQFDFSTTDPNIVRNPKDESQRIIFEKLKRIVEETKPRLTFDEAAIFIIIAIKNDGIKNSPKELREDLESIFSKRGAELDKLVNKAIDFSEAFQKEMTKLQIFTGNQNAEEFVGMRLKRLTPDYALKMHAETRSTDPQEFLEGVCKTIGITIDDLTEQNAPSPSVSPSARSFVSLSGSKRDSGRGGGGG